ncbi:MAG: SDR family oxidoreductase [Rhodospirillaceae bacterium]|jgi:gluconate 5-dehydrogenase|nr:SDR family oxidoreductase [Rhodospirillaceae bacterium]
MNPLFDMTGRLVLVTGASRGLGFAMAEALSDAGAHVVLNGRDPATLDAKAEALRAKGSTASISTFDVTDEAGTMTALDAIEAEHGPLWGVIANAGIQHRSPIEEFETADFERVVATNLTSCFVLAREAAKRMGPRGGGRIINTVSMLGTTVRPTVPAYIAAKEGLRALTRALAVELGPKGILVNAIAPGYFATEMNQALTEDAEFSAWIEGKTPLGRWGQPNELGGAAVFLMSPAGGFVNGHVLAVDGGMSVQV